MRRSEQQGDRLEYLHLLDSRLHEHPQGVRDDPRALEVDHLVNDEPLHERQA